ncbi:hypothetical protein [Actinokineospora fastidiosa]|uniref:Lipoprotein n=1 Tax=Actinokineospora fastidiosa TaxID=1816 RepID=A0A918GTR3_9PSEU|nr:hypothetical protein [Actinokineospora fastidiosa]GGS58098.1 hypothetical protein GCM10010171_61480 [Actinokineospora fastidiosa]
MRFRVKRGALAASLIAVLSACGGGPAAELNQAMSDEVHGLMKTDGPVTPFSEMTDWEWDEVHVFDLNDTPRWEIEKLLPVADLSFPSSGSGLFVYLDDGRLVRADVIGVDEICPGVYTPTAIVDPKAGCWLRDENMRRFPPT